MKFAIKLYNVALAHRLRSGIFSGSVRRNMRKQIAYGASIAFSLVAITLGACSSSSSPGATGGDASTSDVKAPSDTGVTESPDGGDPACFDPSTVLSFSTAPLPPAANQGKCASDDLVNQFLAACISSAGSDGGTDAAADAGDACDAYIAANADCALCLGGYSAPDAAAPPNTPWPALLQVDEAGDVIPAVQACLAAISTGTDTCKSNYADDDLCIESGCAACSSTDFSTCATDESSDPTTTCLTTDPLDAACQAAINAISQTDADTKCAASTTINSDADFQAVFLAVGRTMCE